MGWNPNFNFSLRDDQVSFGNLILDKKAVGPLCQFLTSLKNGQSLSAEQYSSIQNVLSQWCYTDSEFEAVRSEFEQIKLDISDFKRMTDSYGAKWTASLDSLGSTVNYIAGSKTWIDKYIEYKKIAASLFNELKRHNYQFDMSKLQVWEMRYRDVIQQSTQTELVSSYLDKQRREALANGDPHANEKYAQAMLETGCFTQAQADQHLKMARMFDVATGNQLNKHVVTDIEVEHKDAEKNVFTRDDSQTEPSWEDPQGGTVWKDVWITQDLLCDMWAKINNIYDDPAAQDTCLDIFYNYVMQTFNESGIPTRPDIWPNRDIKSMWSNTIALMNVISQSHNKGLIDTACVYMSAKDYRKILELSFQVPGANGNVVDGYIATNADMLQAWYNIVIEADQDMPICMLSDVVGDCLRQADIDATHILEMHSVDNNKRDRLSALIVLVKGYHDQYDERCPVVLYTKVDKLLRMATGL